MWMTGVVVSTGSRQLCLAELQLRIRRAGGIRTRAPSVQITDRLRPVIVQLGGWACCAVRNFRPVARPERCSTAELRQHGAADGTRTRDRLIKSDNRTAPAHPASNRTARQLHRTTGFQPLSPFAAPPRTGPGRTAPAGRPAVRRAVAVRPPVGRDGSRTRRTGPASYGRVVALAGEQVADVLQPSQIRKTTTGHGRFGLTQQRDARTPATPVRRNPARSWRPGEW